MHSKFFKIISYICNEIKCYTKKKSLNIACYSITILIGLVLGIVISSVSEIDYSSINYFVLISSDEYNIFGTFIKIVLLAFIGHILVYVCCLSKWCCFTPFLALFYAGYRFGIRIVSCIIQDKFSGVLCVIFYIIPLYLVILCSLFVATCIIKNVCYEAGYYKKCSRGCKNIWHDCIKQFLILFLILVIILCLVCLIVPMCVKFIIVI